MPSQQAPNPTEIRKLFNAIAPVYRLNNHLHSLALDLWWRRSAWRLLDTSDCRCMVDLGCGCGELTPRAVTGRQVIAVDIAEKMLQRARSRRTDPVRFIQADAMQPPLADNCCDVVTLSFALRNMPEPQRVLQQCRRLLRPAGQLLILEFTPPRLPIWRQCYQCYFQHLLPITAGWIAGGQQQAYRHLPRSVDAFPDADRLPALLNDAGFVHQQTRRLFPGIAAAHLATRR